MVYCVVGCCRDIANMLESIYKIRDVKRKIRYSSREFKIKSAVEVAPRYSISEPKSSSRKKKKSDITRKILTQMEVGPPDSN